MADAERPAGGPRPRRPTIADIAARTGLHKSTVSRAINGKPRVAERTRARVLATLEEVGYVPSGVAASLRTGRTGQLGLVINGPHDPTRLATMQGAFDAATAARYGLVVYMTNKDGDPDRIYPEALARGWVDGALLLWPSRADAPFARCMYEGGLPLVLIEPEVTVPGVPATYADAYSDGYQCTRYLLELGHRRVGACANPPGWGIEARYLDGYRAALAEAGVPVDPALALAAGWSYDTGYQTATHWLQLLHPPTAMCFRVDMAALGAMAAARDLGRRVPDDLSVIGGDDTQMTSWIKPALTTLRERRSALAQSACELLIALIDGAEAPAEPVLIPTDLLVRQSTGPLRQGSL